MVCTRCKMVIRQGLANLGHEPVSVELGEVVLANIPDDEQLKDIDSFLKEYGFERIDDRRSRLIEQIKTEIISLVHEHNAHLKTNLSDYLSDKLHHEYNYLSSLFSEVEGTTIEQFFISQKIEKVKELLIYDELSLTEIAFLLHYLSVAHLSNQFRKVTGLSPSHFRQMKPRRTPIEKL
jgi:AraC-like DNA-binding protein